MRSSGLATILCVLVAGCGPLQPGRAEPAPVAGQELMTWLVELDDREGFHLYVRNDSERVHRITRVTLTDCVNVAEACGDHRMDVVLCPGEATRVFAVHPGTRDYRQQVYFRWSYGARSYEPGEPVVGADCGRGLER